MSCRPTYNADSPSTNTPPTLQGVLGAQGRRTVLPYALGGLSLDSSARIVRPRASDVLGILEAALAIVDSIEEDEPTVQ
jgi:hypothetical protein